MTCQSTDLELLSRFQVELYSKVSPRVAYSPLCADDLVLMSTDDAEIQTMLDIACKYSCQGDTKQSGLESIRVD
jgi:hypothetical protein